MKKILILMLAAALLLTGCGAPKQMPEPTEAPTEPTAEETAAETETEPIPTEPLKPATERIAALRGNSASAVLLDENGVLSEEDAAACEATLETLAGSELCAAVVITNSLSGFSPERFAEQYYNALFGADVSGFLLLINNDTGNDIYYCGGRALIPDSDRRIVQATRCLVEKDYPAALAILLPDEVELTELPPEDTPEGPADDQE